MFWKAHSVPFYCCASNQALHNLTKRTYSCKLRWRRCGAPFLLRHERGRHTEQTSTFSNTEHDCAKEEGDYALIQRARKHRRQLEFLLQRKRMK